MIPNGPLRLDWLLDELLSDGHIDNQEATRARIHLATLRADQHPLSALAESSLQKIGGEGRWNAEELTRWLAAKAELPYAKIDPLSVDVPSVTTVVGYAYAARAQILPLACSRSKITIAVAQPGNNDWEAELGRINSQRIEKVVANPADIQRYLVEFYALSRSVKASEEEQKLVGSGVENLEHLMELGRRNNLEANDQHVVGIVDWLLQYAFNQRASDIHLEPRRESGKVRFRIDGMLHEVYQMPPKVMTAVCSRLKILARMDVAEKRRPQDGRLKSKSPEGQEIELRLSTMPTTFGEKLVMRVFDPEALLQDFSGLGFAKNEAEIWQGLVGQPHGIVLVTGPTGSGKTTTLYSTLKKLASSHVNVCSIEDPIELVDPSFNQMQVNRDLGVDFSSGIRTLLRQDPDIIMVGEIRDLETAEIAVQAALTGHLVLSTLHTNDAPTAITRLIDLGLPPYLIRATLLGVVAQRLVRRLCPECQSAQAPKPETWRDLAGSSRPVPKKIQVSKGCLSCRATGYLGRVGLFEMLPVNDEFRQHIETGTDSSELTRQARKTGMQSLRESGIRKVLEGRTSIQEILRVTPPTFD